MKIALLTLPLDNNYGCNLQRYSLMKVLQEMGHEVTHIYLKFYARLPWYKFPFSYTKRLIKKLLLRDETPLLVEKVSNKKMTESIRLTMDFYNQYINHTNACYDIQDIKREIIGKFDAYLVGSDQVWRKDCAAQIGLSNYFLGFLKDKNAKRVAYSISLGVDSPAISKREVKHLHLFYQKFQAVSVRELSALKIFDLWQWDSPQPVFCLDPTLLLDKTEYIRLIEENSTANLTENKIFAYILDNNDEVTDIIDSYKRKMQIDVLRIGLGDTALVSIPQWLNNIRQSRFVITDSYHGVVFSIIFRRPFRFLGNVRRGNARIESLFDVFHLPKDSFEVTDYSQLDNCYEKLLKESLSFLEKAF